MLPLQNRPEERNVRVASYWREKQHNEPQTAERRRVSRIAEHKGQTPIALIDEIDAIDQ
jgi:hypothetical protein